MKITPGTEPCPACVKRPTFEPLLLSRKDAAAALAISLRTLDYLIADGHIQTRKLCGRILIPTMELRRFAQQDHSMLRTRSAA
ncbi:helix-turn-helix domain-containing protein [Terriglobus sp.]|uniref:helix-turn-helix domain-containing protein n=1 Tax=Terriglobus sp. TaxID=1889013 RepID=UPI003B00AE3A